MQNEMPKEIWAYGIDDNGSVPVNTNGALQHPQQTPPTKYHHDDVLKAAQEENKRLRELVDKIYNEEDGDFGMVQFLINEFRREALTQGERDED